jgi:hypothetical protein
VQDDLRRTRKWLYVIAAFCVLFLLATGYSRVGALAQTAVAAMVVPPLLIIVSVARNIRRYERGDEPALLTALRGLRALWVVLTVVALLPTAALMVVLAIRLGRSPGG